MARTDSLKEKPVCLVCTDPDNYQGCVGCGKVVRVRGRAELRFCSQECLHSDIIAAPIRIAVQTPEIRF